MHQHYSRYTFSKYISLHLANIQAHFEISMPCQRVAVLTSKQLLNSSKQQLEQGCKFC